MELLIDHHCQRRILVNQLRKETQRSAEDITIALDGLLKEHLITRSRGVLRLPSELAESPH